MAVKSSIEWTDATWNPIRGRLKEDLHVKRKDGLDIISAGKWGYHCEHASPGCLHCYAETMNGRTLPAWGTGLKYNIPNREKVEIFLDEEELLKPLKWKRPRKIFPCSMTDLFGSWVADEIIDRVVAVMALCDWHDFLCLTKRSDRLRAYFGDGWHSRVAVQMRKMGADVAALKWTFPNVRLGVSAENQEWFNKRFPSLEAMDRQGWKTMLSIEPMIGPIDVAYPDGLNDPERCCSGAECACYGKPINPPLLWGMKDCWLIIGGESGHCARPFDMQWARSIVRQCKSANVPVFVKQVGAKPCQSGIQVQGGALLTELYRLKDRKGGDMSEWPEDLRVREFPEVKHG